MTNKFSYDGFFTEQSEDLPMSVVEHAKYDFAVAYPAPETLPMDGLVRAPVSYTHLTLPTKA